MKRWLAVLAAVLAAFEVHLWWPQIRDEFFVLLGSRNEAGGYYGFNSGAGGAFYMSLLPALVLFYWHNTCHEKPSCLRWGKYEVAGGIGKKCHRHHPDLKDAPREHHGAVLDELHGQWRARQR